MLSELGIRSFELIEQFAWTTKGCSVRTASLRKRCGLALAYALGRFHLSFTYVLGKFYPYFAYALGNYRYLCRKKQRYNHYDTQTIN